MEEKLTMEVQMKWIISLVFCLMVSPAWAGCTANIVASSLDENGNIVISTQHICDGQEIPSRYPKIDGKYVWQTRYSFQNFDGMTEAQRNEYILNDVSKFDESLIAKNFTGQENAKQDFKSLIGQSKTINSTEMQISQTKAFLISTEGKLSEKAITPISIDMPIK
jgi:hypothetical protein